MTVIDKLDKGFEGLSNSQVRYFQSPGRINLIGDHTDYNLGWVMPAAIDKYVTLAIRENDTEYFNVKALDLNESQSLKLRNIDPKSKEHWFSYFRGVTSLLISEGVKVKGFDCIFTSDIPIGAGLSSSAAISCCFAFALNELFKSGLSREKLVRIAQQTEHQFIDLQCGTMDQTASLFGKANHVLKIDCQSQGITYSRLNLKEYVLVICDSQVKHSLASSGYNDRKRECEQVIEYFNHNGYSISSLREVTESQMAKADKLNSILKKRADFVLAENRRVLEASELLSQGNLEALGQLLYHSHEGLKNNYEVSCEEMDFLVDATKQMEFVLGSRMMGGGFGGCTINLVIASNLETFKQEISRQFRHRFNREMRIFDVHTSDGTREITMEQKA